VGNYDFVFSFFIWVHLFIFRLPDVVWSQTHKYLLLILQIPNVKADQSKFIINEDSIYFNGIGGISNNSNYEITVELYSKILKDVSECSILAREVHFKLIKPESEWWPRATKEKLRNVKIDWKRWCEENEDIQVDYEIPEPEPKLPGDDD
jgi:hypothetical protein